MKDLFKRDLVLLLVLVLLNALITKDRAKLRWITGVLLSGTVVDVLRKG